MYTLLKTYTTLKLIVGKADANAHQVAGEFSRDVNSGLCKHSLERATIETINNT